MLNRQNKFSTIRFMTVTIPFFTILAALVLILNCSTEKKSGPAEMPNPLKVVNTYDEAKALTGFTPKIPASIPIKPVSRKIIVIADVTVSVVYTDKSGNEVIYRMSTYKGDVSGDYTVYPVTVTEQIKGMNVTLKGSSKERFSVAVWNDGTYSYSASNSAGFTIDSIKKLIESIR